ncbi:hypothetical protein [uncultured Gammaproteobacteria bacterium]|nr:hypothetical protein [uncultured Gammaproteobacteria bacterium]
MYINLLKQLIKIYHHIGGLENWNFTQSLTFYIYHHIGGLEKVTVDHFITNGIYHHIGGLENPF